MIVIEKIKALFDALNTRAHAGKTFKILTDMNEELYSCTNLNAIYSTAIKLRLCRSMSAKLFIVDGNKVKSVKHTHTPTIRVQEIIH